MRLKRLLPVAVLLGAVLGTPAEGAPQGELLLRGTGHVSVDVTLRQRGSVDLGRFLPDRRAAYSGVVLRDSRGAHLGMAIQVQRWTTVRSAPPPVATVTGAIALPPGRYTVELLAGGPATVRIPATGGMVRAVTASRRASSRVTLTDLGAAGLPVSNQRYPGVRVPSTGAAVLTYFKRTTAHQASVPQLCFTKPAAPTCALAAGFTSVLASPGSVGDGWVQSFAAIYGGDGVDGTYDALAQVAAVDAPTGMDALLVTL